MLQNNCINNLSPPIFFSQQILFGLPLFKPNFTSPPYPDPITSWDQYVIRLLGWKDHQHKERRLKCQWTRINFTKLCSARDLNSRLLTFKQSSSWFTVPSQGNLLENLITTTSTAAGNQTQVSRLSVQRADPYTIAEEWWERGTHAAVVILVLSLLDSVSVKVRMAHNEYPDFCSIFCVAKSGNLWMNILSVRSIGMIWLPWHP